MVSKVFELKIYKNRTPITTIHQERDIINTKMVWVDKLMLKDGARLMHPKLGVIGFGDSMRVANAAGTASAKNERVEVWIFTDEYLSAVNAIKDKIKRGELIRPASAVSQL